MGSRVELFAQIRGDHDREGLSIHALARRHGVHRRTVRQALESAVPPTRKSPAGRPAPRLGEYRSLIDSWLVADRDAPRKQRHTAHRVWERLRDEHGVECPSDRFAAMSGERRRELGEALDGVFVPLCHEPGVEAEVDWGRSSVVIAGVMTEIFLFLCARVSQARASSRRIPGRLSRRFLRRMSTRWTSSAAVLRSSSTTTMTGASSLSSPAARSAPGRSRSRSRGAPGRHVAPRAGPG
jgi:transposase